MSLRPNSFQEAVDRIKAQQRRRAARSPRAPKQRTLGAGRKTKEWQAAWREMKPRFERAGVVFCELRRDPNCTPNHFLTPAHSRKRRNITTPEGLREIVIACVHCHQAIELLPEAEMEAIVQGVIAARLHPV